MKLIYCRGGDKKAIRIARKAEVDYGIRGDYVAYQRPYMIDYDFSKPVTPRRWETYLTKIRRYKPYMALVPDYFEFVAHDTLLAQIKHVQAAGAVRVAVCPKWHGAVAHIPQGCIIALSVPTEYAGFLPADEECNGRELHLLGGAPDQHLYLIRNRYPRAKFLSADGNTFAMKASFGQFWSACRGDWIQVPSRRYSDDTLAIASLRNWRRYLENCHSFYHDTERVRKCYLTTHKPMLLI